MPEVRQAALWMGHMASCSFAAVAAGLGVPQLSSPSADPHLNAIGRLTSQCVTVVSVQGHACLHLWVWLVMAGSSWAECLAFLEVMCISQSVEVRRESWPWSCLFSPMTGNVFLTLSLLSF